ncbi:MAG: quinoprotein relay system zinc metallohydrolase 1 [Burkholderiales bacterium]
MKLVFVLWLACAALPAHAGQFDYHLTPQKIAADTYVIIGKTEDFNFRNGGNVVNSGFIVTSAGVLVIDTGPSKRYGEQMRAAIGKITDKPVVKVINTHEHPDHFLGNQAFAARVIAATSQTIQGIRHNGEAFNGNMYRLNGDWMLGTEVVVPNQVQGEATETLGDHTISYFVFHGHTPGDLALFDRSTGVLFSGDLVFHDRSPTTPHADLKQWFAALDTLEKLPFKVMVPGHGPVVEDQRALAQTRDYLQWLQATLKAAAGQGRDMAEVLALPLPEKFRSLGVVQSEFARSISHLYPRFEQETLHH